MYSGNDSLKCDKSLKIVKLGESLKRRHLQTFSSLVQLDWKFFFSSKKYMRTSDHCPGRQ